MKKQTKLDRLYDLKGKVRKKLPRKGRMPAGLRRYWATHRRGRKMSSSRPRQRRTRTYDFSRPRRRRPRLSIRHVIRRRYDFGGKPGFMGGALRAMFTALGGIAHDYLTSKGFLPGTWTVGGVTTTKIGAIMGIGTSVWEGLRLPHAELVGSILAGGFDSGFTVPGLEGAAKSGVLMAAGNRGGGVMTSYIPPGAYS